MLYRHCTFSDQGPYPENQDALDVWTSGDRCVACIADGVGGASHGRDAAQTAVQYFRDALESDITSPLEYVVEAVNTELLRPQEHGFFTTFSCVLIRALMLNGVHAGDTRVCVLRGNGIKQLSEDHTEYSRLYKAGKLTPEDAATYPRKHILDNALGIGETPRIDSFTFELEPGDRIILTTDGVHGLLSKIQIRDISREYADINAFVAGVAAAVQNAKPIDNYTVVAIEVA